MSKKVKKVLLIVALLIAVLAAAAMIAGPSFMGSQILAASTELVPREQTLKNVQNCWEMEQFDVEAFQAKYQIQEAIATQMGEDEHNLPFDVITKEGNKNIVVMAHGLGGTRQTNYFPAQIFLENGCNVITYDQRNSGGNTADCNTFGCLEKFDLIYCIRYARANFPDAKIFVWGESMGGATALLAVAHEDVQKDVTALILDCPLSSMNDMMEIVMGEMNIPIPMDKLIAWGSAATEKKLGFTYADAEGTAAAEKITIPTLVINSRVDEMTPYFMGVDVYEHLASEKKELFTSETSKHIEIKYDDPEGYEQKIVEFLSL